MRHETWVGGGKKIEDTQVTRVGGVPTFIDHIRNTTRPATREEIAALLAEEREEKREQAKTRLITAAINQKGNGPWGQMIYDLLIVLGHVEPD